MTCHIDIESFSEEDLRASGVYRYAEHGSTEILVVCYAFDDDPVCTWVPDDDLPSEIVAHMECYHDTHGGEFISGAQCPFELAEYVESGRALAAHNAGFERVMLNGHPGQKIGFPRTEIEQWKCTAAKAAAHSLPRFLEGACKALGTLDQKSVSGRGVMLQLAKPRRKKDEPRWVPRSAPDKFIALYEYCVDDVAAERALDNDIPDLPPAEQKVWEMDQRINDRGVTVDLESVHHVIHLVVEYKQGLAEECRELTGYSPSQTAKIAEWIRDQGYDIANLQAPTIDTALKDPECPKKVKKALKLRRLTAMNAPAKYDAMVACAGADNRIRGMFMYHGASTGRWSSRLVQLQNLHRGFLPDPEVAIEAYAERDLDWLCALYDENPMKIFVSTIRGMLTAAPGKELICCDYKAFEGRALAWLADDQNKLEIYRSHGMVYEDTVARLFDLPRDLESLARMKTENYSRYMQGKTTELACGYQSWVAGLMGMAETFRVDLDEERAQWLANAWRERHPEIVKFWGDLNRAAVAAIGAPGRAFKAGKHLSFVVQGRFLYMVLPSKRRLAYFLPEVDGDTVTFMGTDTYTRQWTRCQTYGGRLAQNACEAVTRDILAAGAMRLEKAGYDLIGTVHDEIIAEREIGSGTIEEMCALMCQQASWNEGFPIDAEGFIAYRYRKD